MTSVKRNLRPMAIVLAALISVASFLMMFEAPSVSAQSTNPERDDFASQVQTYFEVLVSGGTPETLTRTYDVEKTYFGDLISVGLLPYLPCAEHGNECAEIKTATAGDIKVVFTENEGMLDVEFGSADYGSWQSITTLFTSSGKEGNVAVCAEIDVYTNSSLSVIVSKDFSAVEETVSPHIAQMRTLLASEGASVINGKRCALRYIYQTRTHQEKGLEEERYIYYAFFEKDGMEYLVQFTSNYTLPNTNQSALGNGYSLKTQQQCRAAFESILADVLVK